MRMRRPTKDKEAQKGGAGCFTARLAAVGEGEEVAGENEPTKEQVQFEVRDTEVFRFPVPRSSGGSISFKVHYEHSPTATPECRTWLTVVSEDRTFPAL